MFRFVVSVAALAVASAESLSLRLSYLPDGMTISFSTESDLSHPPTVMIGTSPNQLSRSVTGETKTYPGSRFFHHIPVHGLNPNSVYYYAVAPDENLAALSNSEYASDVKSFTTARDSSDSTPIQITVIGDMGLKNSADTQAAAVDLVDSSDFFWHLGDHSYADDYYLRSGDDYEGSWNKWQEWVEPITSTKAYMTLPGNHEATCNEATPFLCPTGQKNFTAYRNRFYMPSSESGTEEIARNMYYSYNYGFAHFISIDCESTLPDAPEGEHAFWIQGGPFGDQLAWLENDLIQASSPEARAQRPWIIVGGHRPFFSSGKPCAACVKAFEPLFLKYGVDLYFGGHTHWYERLWPVVNGKVVSKSYDNIESPIYIVNGAAGNVEGHYQNILPLKDVTALMNNKDYGYGRLYLHNATHATWQYWRAADRTLADELTIAKARKTLTRQQPEVDVE